MEKTHGNTVIHTYLYNRVDDYRSTFPNLVTRGEKDRLLEITENHRNQDVINFFKNKGKFIHLELEDDYKWIKLGRFIGIKVDHGYDTHKNRYKKQVI